MNVYLDSMPGMMMKYAAFAAAKGKVESLRCGIALQSSFTPNAEVLRPEMHAA